MNRQMASPAYVIRVTLYSDQFAHIPPSLTAIST